MKTWEEIHNQILSTPELVELKAFIRRERETKSILPAPGDVFNAYKLTPYDNVRIVILGQDPYPDKTYAHGLAFSCSQANTIPQSLMNIFKEITRSLYPEGTELREIFKSGNLTKWASQGILLINTVLTVEEGNPGSHQGKGWELFTSHIVKSLNEHPRNLVFMLLGKKAQEIAPIITNKKRHLILETSHPSPLSVKQGFEGSGVFRVATAFVRDDFFDLRKYIYGQKIFLEDMIAFGIKNNVTFDIDLIKKMPLFQIISDVPNKTVIDWTT